MNDYFRFRHFKTLALVLLPISISLLSCKGGGIADGADLSRAENSSSDLAPYIPKGPLTFAASTVHQIGAITKPTDSNGSDHCRSVATDLIGNIYCTGYTSGSLGETNGGYGDVFIAKWNSSGTLLWIKQLGAITKPGASNSSEESFSIKLDNKGNIFIGGYTDGSLGESNGGGTDVFIAKMNSSGTLQWIKQLGAVTKPVASAGQDMCYSIALDSAGNIYCGGTTNGSLGEMNGYQNEPCSSSCNPDAFVAKWDKNGNLKWIKQIGHLTIPYLSRFEDECRSVAIDSKDNIYCSGHTTGHLGESNGTYTSFGSNGNKDAILFKLNSDGNLIWIKQLGMVTAPLNSFNSDHFEAITIDRTDNIYCGGGTQGNLGEASGHDMDAFISKWSTDGNLKWISQMGGVTKPYKSIASEWCTAITTDQIGSVFCAGTTSGPLEEASGGEYDAFIAKWNSAGTLIWTKQLGNVTKNNQSNGHDFCHGLAIDSSNNLICAGYTDSSLGETNGGTLNSDAFIWIQPDGR